MKTFCADLVSYGKYHFTLNEGALFELTPCLLKGGCNVSKVNEVVDVGSLQLAMQGTEFQKTVWRELLTIPRGKVFTYKDVANNIGKHSSVRAVANAVGANKIAVLIPCHRVIRSDGGLGGYRWGVEEKKRLLDLEII